MKKNLSFILILLFCGFSLNAQVTATMTPESVTKAVNLDLTNLNHIVKGHGILTNTSATTQSFKWVVEKTEGPEEWEFQLCDKNQCFAFAIASNIDTAIGLSIPVTLESNTISIMDLGVKPNGMAGHGIYKVTVSTVANPETILATAIYDFQIDNLTSTTNFNRKAIKIFPNPVTGYFSLTDNELVKQLQIFNIVGKKMMDMSFRNGDAINVSSFPNGLYLVRMMGENGEVLRTTRMTKR